MAIVGKPDLEILVVEDDKIMGLLQKKVLQAQNNDFPISIFENGSVALDYIESSPASVSFLILLDINMPIMNGWEFLEELQKRKEGSRFQVAMVTSSIYQVDKIRASKFPQVIGYFEKPFLKASAREFFEKPEVSILLNSPQAL